MSIRQKFVALLLFIGLVPTLIVSTVAFVTISSERNKSTRNQLVSIDKRQQQRVNVLLQAKQEEVIKLSNSYDFQTAMGRFLAARDKPGIANIQAIIHQKLSQVPGVKVINIADLDDKIIASTQADMEGSKLQNPVSHADTAEGAVISITKDGDDLDKLFISTHLSINKKDSAVLQVVYRIDDLVAAVNDYTGLGLTGETVVLASSGADGQAKSLLPLRFSDKSQQTAYGKVKDGKAIDYRGHEVMVTSRPIGFSNWTIATKIDTAEAFSPISKLRDSLFWIFVVSSAVIAVIAFYLTRVFTAPILRVAAAAQRIGQGDFDARVDLNRSDEIGTLADSVNTMGTSLKSMVSGLESQRNHLEVILNSTNDTIIAVDRRGVITTANSPAIDLTGKPISDLIGKHFSDVFNLSADHMPFVLDFAKPVTNNYPNIEYMDSGSAHHYVKLMVAAFKGNQAEDEQTLITIHDQTKSRELEDMKVDFVSMAAHELRTPLAAIRGYLELINFKLKDIPPEITGYIQQSLRSVVELGSLINNLLDVSRIERGTLTLDMTDTDLAIIAGDALKDVGFVAADKRVKLLYDGPHEGCIVKADDVALKEVISNLLTNAVKYTPEDGRVDAILSLQDGSYRFSVRDSGIGIPKDAQSHLFTKFFRVKGGLASGNSGTGLGLFIAKSIVERHGGTIWVESEVNAGSIFTFTIPMQTAGPPGSDQAEERLQDITTRRHRGWITKNIAR